MVKMDKGWTEAKRPKEKKINGDVQGFTPERWDRQIISIKKRKKKVTHLNWVDATIEGHGEYTRKNHERLLAVASNSNINIRTSGKTTKFRKQKWE